MEYNLVIWLWIFGVISMQIIPWSISGIEGIFQVIPDNYGDNSKYSSSISKFFSDLFQNQIVILFIVPFGIVLLDQVKTYGLTPSHPVYYYLLSPIFGSLLIYIGIKVSRLTSLIMQKFMIAQLDHDCKQYAYNMRNIFQKKTWQKILLGLFNGFSEELLLRVFLMGVMIHYFNIIPIYAFITSILINGLHHTKQGRILGVIPIMIIQSFYAAAYLIFNDYLIIGLMHMGTDITGLLLPNILSKRQKDGQES
jgi:membrane protease YdiL (CAAX protease family)